jgi:hypothetical protein
MFLLSFQEDKAVSYYEYKYMNVNTKLSSLNDLVHFENFDKLVRNAMKKMKQTNVKIKLSSLDEQTGEKCNEYNKVNKC